MNITLEEYRILIDIAPGDHSSCEFVTYFEARFNVFLKTEDWLVIEHPVYHKNESPWYTAFLLHDKNILDYNLQLLQWEMPGMKILLEPKASSEVDRFCVHMFKSDRLIDIVNEEK